MEANQVLILNKLIDMGADVNCIDQERRTPLHYAAESGQARVIKALIQRGSTTFFKDSQKKTPLELAANDHVKELIIAYTAPEYLVNTDQNEQEKPTYKKYDVKVNKKGQIQRAKEFDPPLEPPPLKQVSPLKAKKKRVKIAQTKEVIEEAAESLPERSNQQAPAGDQSTYCVSC